ncbi:ABC transporter substrate-binding protein [Pseudonocardia sp.]|uniref:ABC transporter substrate-binding protein n=1 Tax=Pseudonocardia sp. TaxID=60912 RepID=UPI00262D32DC|nr:ABC transporter substrate-binding protein [Pseudonocardia sp.]
MAVPSTLSTCAAAAAVLLLAACGGPAPTSASAPAGEPGFPVTIEHAFGSTTIPAAPSRIVALSFEEDVLSRIGLTTVGHLDNLVEPGVPYAWQVGEVDLSTSRALGDPGGAIGLEEVAALDPDLILATNYFALEDVYEGLSAIAPTVGFRTGWGEASWQDTARVIGQAVGREAAVEEQVAEVEAYVDALAAELPGLQGRTFSSVYNYEPGMFAVDTNPQGHTARLLGELGMSLSPRIVAEVENRSLSAERIGLIDADLVGLGFAGDELRAELTASPLYRALPAVQDRRVHLSDVDGATAGNNPTLLNVRWNLEQQRPVLERVAAS